MTARALVPLAALLAIGPACRSLAPVEVRVEMPGVSRLAPGSFDEIVVMSFLDEAPSPDFETGREFQAYLTAELARAFHGPVTAATSPAEAAANPADPSFWKWTSAGHERAIILAGTVRLAGDVRKALQDKAAPVDGPFKTGRRGLIEYRRWTLLVDLSVISAATGDTLHRQVFDEDRDYIDLEKPADFSFYELSDRVRDKLFSILLGKSTFEPRTLLKR